MIVNGEKKILSYEKYFPNQFDSETIIAFHIIISWISNCLLDGTILNHEINMKHTD